MKLSHGLAAIVLTMSAAAVHADVRDRHAVSDYDFRGSPRQQATRRSRAASITRTRAGSTPARGPATSISAIAATRTSNSTSTPAAAVARRLPTTSVRSITRTRAQTTSISRRSTRASAGKCSPARCGTPDDFGNSSDSAEYYELNANDPAAGELRCLGLHIGYSDGDYWGKR